jgi:hypothetical protein
MSRTANALATHREALLDRDRPWRDDVAPLRGTGHMEGGRKPLAKVEGRRRLRASGLTIAWRGTPSLDDWVAYIVNGTKSRRLILLDDVSERKFKLMLARLQTMSKKEVEKLAKA